MVLKQNHDLTTGKINFNVFLLALPMTFEMIMQAAFNIVDMFFVGKLGPAAISAVTMVGIFIMVVFSLAQGIAIGGGAMVARRIGEKNIPKANETVMQALFIGAVASIMVAVLGAVFAPSWLNMLGASEEVIRVGVGYMRISFIGSFSIIFLFVINAIFRGAGEAKAAMYLLGFANIINIILDPLLIFGIGFFPRLGVEGAAVATVISRVIAVSIQIVLLFKGYLIVHLKKTKVTPDWEIIKTMLKIAFPGSMILFLRTFSLLVLTRIVAIYGTLILAAYGIGIRIYQLVLFPGFGLANAAATLVGQNLGARRPRRAELSAWLAAGYNSVIMGFAALFFYWYAEPIVSLFNNNPVVVKQGASFVRLMSHSYVFLGIGVVLGRSFVGAGDTLSPMTINFIALWVFQLPAAYLMAQTLGWGADGIWISMALTSVFNTILFAAWFRMGLWKKTKV